MKLIIPPRIQVKLPIQSPSFIEGASRIPTLENLLYGLHTRNTDLIRAHADEIRAVEFVQAGIGLRGPAQAVLVCGPELGERGGRGAGEVGERREVAAAHQC